MGNGDVQLKFNEDVQNMLANYQGNGDSEVKYYASTAALNPNYD